MPVDCTCKSMTLAMNPILNARICCPNAVSHRSTAPRSGPTQSPKEARQSDPAESPANKLEKPRVSSSPGGSCPFFMGFCPPNFGLQRDHRPLGPRPCAGGCSHFFAGKTAPELPGMEHDLQKTSDRFYGYLRKSKRYRLSPSANKSGLQNHAKSDVDHSQSQKNASSPCLRVKILAGVEREIEPDPSRSSKDAAVIHKAIWIVK